MSRVFTRPVTPDLDLMVEEYPLVRLAVDFMTQAHRSINQRRTGGEPYEYHLLRVADTVARITRDAFLTAAALVHDVLEDVAPLRPEFGADPIRALLGGVVFYQENYR